MKRIIMSLTAILFLFAACEKEEIALPAPNQNTQQTLPTDTSGNELLIARGQNVLQTVSLGATYSNQIWFDLGTNSLVKSNNRMEWDLAFESHSGEYIVYLNSSNIGSAYESTTTDFSQQINSRAEDFQYDISSGKVDSLAIGKVENNRNVWIIDRGFRPSGSGLGKWKFKIEETSNNSYTIRFGKLDDTLGTTLNIPMNPTKGRVAVSFESGQLFDLEPNKEAFDICFTQYTYVFYEPTFYPYSVNGVLLNSYRTQAIEAFDVEYSKIDLGFAKSKFYSNDLDLIGYDWKFYDFGTSSYVIDSTKVYILKDAAGNYFKLRFLDFYDENGIKGAPSFEYQRL